MYIITTGNIKSIKHNCACGKIDEIGGHCFDCNTEVKAIVIMSNVETCEKTTVVKNGVISVSDGYKILYSEPING